MRFPQRFDSLKFPTLAAFALVVIAACANTVSDKKSGDVYSRQVCEMGGPVLNLSMDELAARYGNVINETEMQPATPGWTLLSLRFSSGAQASVAVNNSKPNQSTHVLSLAIESANVETGAHARIGDSIQKY